MHSWTCLSPQNISTFTLNFHDYSKYKNPETTYLPSKIFKTEYLYISKAPKFCANIKSGVSSSLKYPGAGLVYVSSILFNLLREVKKNFK